MPSFATKLQNLCTRIAHSSKRALKKGPLSSQNASLEDGFHVYFQPKYLGDYSDFASCTDSSTLDSQSGGSPTSSLSSVLLPPGIATTISSEQPVTMSGSSEQLSNMFSWSESSCSLDASPLDSRSLYALSDSDTNSSSTHSHSRVVYPERTFDANLSSAYSIESQTSQSSVDLPTSSAILLRYVDLHWPAEAQPYLVALPEGSPSESTSLYALSTSPSDSSSMYNATAIRRPVNMFPYLNSDAALGSHLQAEAPSSTSTPPRATSRPVLRSVKVQTPVEVQPNFIEIDFAYPMSSAYAVFPMPMALHVPQKASADRTVCDSSPDHHQPSSAQTSASNAAIAFNRSLGGGYFGCSDVLPATSSSEWPKDPSTSGSRCGRAGSSVRDYAPTPAEWLKNSRMRDNL